MYMELEEKINKAYDTWRGGREEFEKLMKDFYNLGRYEIGNISSNSFRPGDWIVSGQNNRPCKVISVNESDYFLDSSASVPDTVVDSSTYRLGRQLVERDYRRWTLKDCRPGDLIVARETDKPFMGLFKNLKKYPDGKQGLGLYAYLCAGHREFYREDTDDCAHATDNFTPATQEEADVFFTVLKKKGFVWNPKTLVLSKVPVLKFKEGDVIEKGSKRALVKYYYETDQEYRLIGNDCYCLPIQEQDKWHKVEKVDPVELACFWLEDTFSCSTWSSGRGESTEWYCSFDSKEEMLAEFEDFMKTYTK